MALVQLQKAAEKLGVSLETLETWAARGLLEIQTRLVTPPPGMVGLVQDQRLVDEDDAVNVAESLGWLQLSSDGWDGDED